MKLIETQRGIIFNKTKTVQTSHRIEATDGEKNAAIVAACATYATIAIVSATYGAAKIVGGTVKGLGTGIANGLKSLKKNKNENNEGQDNIPDPPEI